MKKEEIIEILKPYNEDIKRHMSILKEDFQDKIKPVAELLGAVKEDVEIIKSDIEFVKKTVSRGRLTMKSSPL